MNLDIILTDQQHISLLQQLMLLYSLNDFLKIYKASLMKGHCNANSAFIYMHIPPVDSIIIDLCDYQNLQCIDQSKCCSDNYDKKTLFIFEKLETRH